MNVELIGALARIRREELLAEAHIYRRLKAADAARRGRSMRTTLARAVRAFGYAALSLGDALAESR